MSVRLGPTFTIPNKDGKASVPYQDRVDIEFQPTGTASSAADVDPSLQKGTPSLFNPYALVVFPSSADQSIHSSRNQLLDGGSFKDPNSLTGQTQAQAGNLFSPPAYKPGSPVSTPTIQNLVEDPKLAIKTPYYYTDFLYCKYVGKIPLNQLITLRRYPAPTFDNLAVPSTISAGSSNKEAGKRGTSDVELQPEFFPIAQAVTWFGEETGNKLSELLGFTVNFNWKLVEAEVNTVPGNEQGSDDSPAPGVAKFLGILTGQVNTPFTTANSQYDPYNNGPYSNRVYGPVNVISKTFKRERGLDYKQSFSLNFEYSLKSIGNINPKAAMLDLMSNMLALTYNNAAFWGGANRYFPQKPTYPFLGGKDGMNAWYKGDAIGFAKSVGTQISDSKNAIGDILSKLAADPISTLKQLAAGAAKLGMVEMGKGKAPAIISMKALLTGEPIGEWHMVVGNPYAPIAMIGNLICTEAKFQFNDIIGADNFPTELKVTITVEHGRPRDAGDIQSMFNQGQGRIYYPPKGVLDSLNNSSATRNSQIDTSWKQGNGGGYQKSTASVGLFTGSAAQFDELIGKAQTNMNAMSATGKLAWQTADQMFLRTGGSETRKK
jgi:hypothetical protein